MKVGRVKITEAGQRGLHAYAGPVGKIIRNQNANT
jgi:hypothetical protein